MGFGDTARKMSKVASKAESIYKIAQELRKRITELKQEIDEVHSSVKTLDQEMENQRQISESQSAQLRAHKAVIDEIAKQHGINPADVRHTDTAQERSDSSPGGNSETAGSDLEQGDTESSSPEDPGDDAGGE